jgi:hypothetical protein
MSTCRLVCTILLVVALGACKARDPVKELLHDRLHGSNAIDDCILLGPGVINVIRDRTNEFKCIDYTSSPRIAKVFSALPTQDVYAAMLDVLQEKKNTGRSPCNADRLAGVPIEFEYLPELLAHYILIRNGFTEAGNAAEPFLVDLCTRLPVRSNTSVVNGILVLSLGFANTSACSECLLNLLKSMNTTEPPVPVCVVDAAVVAAGTEIVPILKLLLDGWKPNATTEESRDYLDYGVLVLRGLLIYGETQALRTYVAKAQQARVPSLYLQPLQLVYNALNPIDTSWEEWLNDPICVLTDDQRAALRKEVTEDADAWLLRCSTFTGSYTGAKKEYFYSLK